MPTAKKAKPIPEGYHSVTPHIVVRGAAKAIAFYEKAFGAEEKLRMPGPEGKIVHAELQIGDSVVMLSDEFPAQGPADEGAKAPETLKGTTGGLMLYVKDVDKMFERAVKAGAKTLMPVTDMFWGDRYGKLMDPFGHVWAIATHTEDVSPKEIEKRQAAFLAEMRKAAKKG
jgi:PhnB protein